MGGQGLEAQEALCQRTPFQRTRGAVHRSHHQEPIYGIPRKKMQNPASQITATVRERDGGVWPLLTDAVMSVTRATNLPVRMLPLLLIFQVTVGMLARPGSPCKQQSLLPS